MADLGKNAIMGHGSIVAIGRETAYGTYITSTSGLEFLTCNLTTKKEGKMLEEMVRFDDRAYSNRIITSKVIEGDIEFNFRAESPTCNYILQQALGGTITTTAVSAASSYLHACKIGNMENNKATTTANDYKGLSIYLQKGDTNAAKSWLYSGVRVNELAFTAEIDNALVVSASLVGKDSTFSTALTSCTFTSDEPLLFTNARISIEESVASLTSATYWHIESAEFGWSNELKTDTASRRLGSDTLDVCPAGVMTPKLTLNMRFDTITAYNYMMNATRLAAELKFEGNTITGSSLKKYLKLTMPKLYINTGTDPEIGGPDEILKCSLEFHVLNESATSQAVQVEVLNGVSTYA